MKNEKNNTKNTSGKNSTKISKDRKKIIKSVSILFIFFFLSAVFSALFGKWLDAYFDMKPWGNIISFGISYIFTWIVIFWYYRKNIKNVVI